MITRVIAVIIILLLSLAAIIIPKTNFKNFISNTQAYQTETAQQINQNFPKPAPNYQEAPVTSARAIAIIDSKTGISFYEKDSNTRYLPASTIKMMTALVALENCSPKDIVTVKSVQKEGTQMGLEVGDRLTVENLLYGMLLSSGNDAAYALANACASSYNDFIGNMNQKAIDLEMKNTHFINPAGFDDNLQYSTALDLAKLAKIVVANPLIAKIVSTKSSVVTDITGNKTYTLENVDKLLGVVAGLEGVKTGQTEGSLGIFISKITRDGNTVIIAVLGSNDRFGESEQLIDWVFKNHIWPKH